MSIQFIQSELFEDLSIEQQQPLSGGQRRFVAQNQDQDQGQNFPVITVIGNLTTNQGESFPVRITGFRLR